MAPAIEQLLHALTRAVSALSVTDIRFAMAGGCAMYARRGRAFAHDVDPFLKPEDVGRAGPRWWGAGDLPFLGSYPPGEVIDEAGAALALHSHAHAGTERGTTPGGIRVRNVAQPVIRTVAAVYELREPAATGAGHRVAAG